MISTRYRTVLVSLDNSKEISIQEYWRGIEKFVSGNQFDNRTLISYPDAIQDFRFQERKQELKLTESNLLYGFAQHIFRSKVVHGKFCHNLSTAINNPNTFLLKTIFADHLQVFEEKMCDVNCFKKL